MLSNVNRLRVYALSIVVAVVIIGIFLNISARTKLSDIRLLSGLRSLSYALEQYKGDNWQYPHDAPVDLEKQFVLTEAGFAPGNHVYFKGPLRGRGTVSYRSDGITYTIRFNLYGTWSDQGLKSNECTITENYQLRCGKDKAS